MNEYKEYLETGILGSYKPESAIIKKSDSGASVAVFRDSSYTLTDDTCTREREMLIKGKRFIISSVFPLDARATATDNVLGRVTNEQFRILSADYNDEQREIDEALPLKEERLEKLKSSSANVDAFIEKAKRYKTIDKLTPEIVRLFIARIEIGERTVKYSRHSAQKIRIIYRDIGEWDYDDAAEAEQQQPQIVAVTVAQPELLPA